MKYVVKDQRGTLLTVNVQGYVPEGVVSEAPQGDYNDLDLEVVNGRAVVSEEKKTTRLALISAEEERAQARGLLQSTDWYIIREMDSGAPTPQEIKEARAKAREVLKG